MAASLQLALKEHALPLEECKARFGPFLFLAGRLLGTQPQFITLGHLSIITSRFYFGALRPCFRIPSCDLGFGAIDARTRRIAILESSLVHQCPYCSAHCAGIGDVVNGSLFQQCLRAGGLANYSDLDLRDADDVVRRFAREVCDIPARLTDDTRKAFLSKYGQRGYLEITSILAFMGWLNFVMASAGTRLESRIAPFAKLMLQPHSVSFSLDDQLADDGERELGEQDLEIATNTRSLSSFDWVRAQLQNFLEVISLVPVVLRATFTERPWFAGIPNAVHRLDAWLFEHLNCLPKVFERVTDRTLKRALAFAFKLLFIDEENTVWTNTQKSIFFYVFCKRIQNAGLLEDAVALADKYKERSESNEGAHRESGASASPSGLEAKRHLTRTRLEKLFCDAESEERSSDSFSAACRYVYLCADVSGGVTESVIESLTLNVETPSAVVDLVGFIGMFAFLHRVSVLVPEREGV